TGNYSYECDRTHGESYLLLGDAFAFIDPVFSSGVMMAMQSAFAAADTVEVCLNQPQQMHTALKNFDRTMRVGPKIFSWFIYRVTNPVIRNMFMEPRNIFRAKEAVLSVLAGDVYGTTPIQKPLFLFKAIYYTASLLNLKRTIKSWKMRQNNIKPVEETGSTVN
ncbi:MAG: hydroxylase, partial [Methylophilaceae bacterium]